MLATIEELNGRRSDLDVMIPRITEAVANVEQRMLDLEGEMEPVGVDIGQIVDARAIVERQQHLADRHAFLESERSSLIDEAATDTAKVSSKMNHKVLADFSERIAKRLAAWGVPEISDVRFDRAEQDIFQANQFRAAHGKGLRSVLHAAFTVALAQYCIERELPHPGFIVLDSPIVTYRPPDHEGDEDDGEVPPTFAAAFYNDLNTQFDGQVIVFENVEPPSDLVGDHLPTCAFSKLSGSGRYGFFPQR